MTNFQSPILIIATYHSSHFAIAQYGLSINKNTKIFIEKPPVTTKKQLYNLLELRKNSAHFIEIGFNRRYSPIIRKIKKLLLHYNGPTTMTCIVKEKVLPLYHWYYWPQEGTRVLGNLSHWIDLGVHLIDKVPISINVSNASRRHPCDEAVLVVTFNDESVLTIIASDRGNSLRGVQEWIQIRKDDITITIDDFLRVTVQNPHSQKIFRYFIRDKGHSQMYRSFVKSFMEIGAPYYPNEDLFITSSLSIDLSESLLNKIPYLELNYHDPLRLVV